jgi:hypothetical protein
MQDVLQTTADEVSLACGFVQRKRKLTGSAFVQTLVFGWLETPDASYADLAQTARALDLDVSRQAIEKRMTSQAAETLKRTLEVAATQNLMPQPQELPLLNQFSGVYVQDSTWITLPDELRPVWKGTGCRTEHKKSSIKLQLRFDVLTGAFEHFQLTDGITADRSAEKQFEPLPAGSLRLADRGYFSLDAFEKLTQTGVFWISRLKAGIKLFDAQGVPFCLLERLTTENSDILDIDCFIGAKKRLSARLVALRCAKQEANKRRRHIRRDAKRRWKAPSKERLQLADWDIYITNVDIAQLTPEQIAAVARVRWQVELMFKSFKSVGKINTSPSTKPDRILCEVYAKLIAQLIKQWVMLATGWKCIKHDIIKTAKLIALHARTLTMSFHKSKTAFYRTLNYIKQDLQHTENGKHRAGKWTTYHHLKENQNP